MKAIAGRKCIFWFAVWRYSASWEGMSGGRSAGQVTSCLQSGGREREREKKCQWSAPPLFIQTMMSTSEMAQPVYWVVFPSQLTLFWSTLTDVARGVFPWQFFFSFKFLSLINFFLFILPTIQFPLPPLLLSPPLSHPPPPHSSSSISIKKGSMVILNPGKLTVKTKPLCIVRPLTCTPVGWGWYCLRVEAKKFP